MARVMEIHMRNCNRQWTSMISKLSEKNITMEDAIGLQAEIEAKSEKLKILIASGKVAQIREFMQTYHDSQLYYAAKFEIARLKGYRNALEPLAEEYKMSDKIHAIDEKIAEAENLTRRGHNYADGEFSNTWSNIKSAGKDMQEAAKEINSEGTKHQPKK